MRSIVFVFLGTLTLLGYVGLADYASRPGQQGTALTTVSLADLPTFEGNTQERSTIVLFYHPKCPCTFATARCLERLSIQFQCEPRTIAYAYCPDSKPGTWVESRTTNILKGLPRTKIAVDRKGTTCRKFGVITSGHVLVYDQRGSLVFSGGITSSRGHEGESASAQALVKIVNRPEDEARGLAVSPVFGCPIVADSEASQ